VAKKLKKFPPAYSKQAELLLAYVDRTLGEHLLRLVSVHSARKDWRYYKTPEQALLVGLLGYCKDQKKKLRARLDADAAVQDLLVELGFNKEGDSHV
jgi:predicted GNAT family N-acyltransferase